MSATTLKFKLPHHARGARRPVRTFRAQFRAYRADSVAAYGPSASGEEAAVVAALSYTD